MNKAMLYVAGIAFLVGNTAFAATPAAGATNNSAPSMSEHRQFTRLDTNKDGYIEKDEAKASDALYKSFDQLAVGGKLSQASFAKWESGMHSHHSTN